MNDVVCNKYADLSLWLLRMLYVFEFQILGSFTVSLMTCVFVSFKDFPITKTGITGGCFWIIGISCIGTWCIARVANKQRVIFLDNQFTNAYTRDGRRVNICKFITQLQKALAWLFLLEFIGVAGVIGIIAWSVMYEW